MLIVAGSGVVGRFLYVEIHHGLTGEKINLRELEAQAGFSSSESNPSSISRPRVEKRLKRISRPTRFRAHEYLARRFGVS